MSANLLVNNYTISDLVYLLCFYDTFNLHMYLNSYPFWRVYSGHNGGASGVEFVRLQFLGSDRVHLVLVLLKISWYKHMGTPYCNGHGRDHLVFMFLHRQWHRNSIEIWGRVEFFDKDPRLTVNWTLLSWIGIRQLCLHLEVYGPYGPDF